MTDQKEGEWLRTKRLGIEVTSYENDKSTVPVILRVTAPVVAKSERLKKRHFRWGHWQKEFSCRDTYEAARVKKAIETDLSSKEYPWTVGTSTQDDFNLFVRDKQVVLVHHLQTDDVYHLGEITSDAVLKAFTEK